MAYTTIDNPELYFQCQPYTANNGTQSITFDGSEDMQPDFVWIKCRTQAYNHALFDSVRGTTKLVRTNQTTAEETHTGTLSAFNSDGFSLNGNDAFTNNGSETYVSWNWKAGTSFSNDASATGIGSIDSSGSFNNDAGFSIVSFTGTGSNATVKHGLNAAPNFIIFKDRSASKDWFVYHQSVSPARGLKINSTAYPSADSTYFQDTAPTSSVFSVGSANTVNASSNNMIAYCFVEKQGYSRFGEFTSINNNSGVFVPCGFAPRWVMIKPQVTDGWSNWYIFDTKRDVPQLNDEPLFANLSTKENYYGGSPASNYDQIDILSNGFKIRRDGNWGVGGSGQASVFMAFAESPFVNSSGIPCNAS